MIATQVIPETIEDVIISVTRVFRICFHEASCCQQNWLYHRDGSPANKHFDTPLVSAKGVTCYTRKRFIRVSLEMESGSHPRPRGHGHSISLIHTHFSSYARPRLDEILNFSGAGPTSAGASQTSNVLCMDMLCLELSAPPIAPSQIANGQRSQPITDTSIAILPATRSCILVSDRHSIAIAVSRISSFMISDQSPS